MKSHINQKQFIINEIVQEINEIPVIYLKTLYALVHSFKETIPYPVDIEEDSFDWDNLLNEIHQNRNKNNLLMSERINQLTEGLL